MAIVIVGDAQDVIPQVRAYSENIEVFDTEGNKKDLGAYAVSDDSETANIAGNWKLSLDFQGQQVPVSLELSQDGELLKGKLETIIGSGEIKDGSINGKRFSATAVTEIQGESVDLLINGSADGDSIAGTISASIIPDPLSFTGSRQN